MQFEVVIYKQTFDSGSYEAVDVDGDDLHSSESDTPSIVDLHSETEASSLPDQEGAASNPDPFSYAVLDSLKKPIHKWTEREKVVLCVLRRWFQNPSKELGLVFNGMFGANLKSTTLDIMWQTQALYRTDIWRKVYEGTKFYAMEGCYVRLKRELRQKAAKEGLVNLIPRTEEETGLKKRLNRMRSKGWARNAIAQKVRAAKNRAAAEMVAERAGALRTKATATTKMVRTMVDATRAASNPKSFVPAGRSNPANPRGIPRLFFRFFDTKSHGCNERNFFSAGSCEDNRDASHMPPCPETLEDVFQLARNHLTRGERRSPFISVTDSLIWALEKAAKSGSTSARIAVIDSNELPESHIFDAVPFCSRLRHELKRYYYKGSFETLIWASIPSSAIISSFSIEDFKQTLNRNAVLSEIVQFELLNSIYTVHSKDSTPTVLRHNIKYIRLKLAKLPLSSFSPYELAGAVIDINTFLLQSQWCRPDLVRVMTRVIVQNFDMPSRTKRRVRLSDGTAIFEDL